MPKVTFEITPKHRKLMDAYPQVNWSEIFRQAIEKQYRITQIARQIEKEIEDPRVQAVAAAVKKGVGERWRRARRR